MKILLTLIAVLTLAASTQAQLNGVVVLKKNRKTIERYFEGKSIEFITKYDQHVSGLITGVVKDTLLIRFIDVQQRANYWGLPTMDTLREVPLAFAFSDITTIVKVRTHLNYTADGIILMAAGVGLLVVDAVNTAYYKQPASDMFSGADIYISLGLIGLGAWMVSLQVKHYHLGNKYHLEYLAFTAPKG
jgi:hypothetical protein